MRIAGALERVLATRPIHPIIIEFSAREAMLEMVPILKEIMSLKEILFPSPPQDALFPLADRVLSRFQAPLFSFKQMPQFNMVALPLLADRIEEVASETKVVGVYPDHIQWAFQTVPPGGMYEYRKELITTTIWTKRLIGADRANEEGWTGRGVMTAVLDTGGTMLHPMTRGMEYHTVMRNKGQVKDTNGHGEWVSATACGKPYFDRSLQLGVDGMAPDSHLLSIKCLGFVVGVGTESDVISAMDLSLNRGADVVNMSFGSDTMPSSPEEDAELRAIDTLVKYDILPVVAAGNSGPIGRTINTPGCSPSAVTVGAIDEINGGIADFSSRGPTNWGDIKPDVMAPGIRIYSACIGMLDISDGMMNRMAHLSGTSMATPHVAGLLTCARQMFKERAGVTLNTAMVKDAMSKFGPNQSKDNDQGWGLITWEILKRYLEEVIGVE